MDYHQRGKYQQIKINLIRSNKQNFRKLISIMRNFLHLSRLMTIQFQKSWKTCVNHMRYRRHQCQFGIIFTKINQRIHIVINRRNHLRNFWFCYQFFFFFFWFIVFQIRFTSIFIFDLSILLSIEFNK